MIWYDPMFRKKYFYGGFDKASSSEFRVRDPLSFAKQ